MRIFFSILIACFSINVFALPTTVEFAGYKYLSKAKVGGVFKDVKVSHSKNAKNLMSILKTLDVSILTKSIDTKDKIRNQNMLTTLFKSTAKIQAKTKRVNINEQYIVMEVKIGKLKGDVTFQYNKVKDELVFTSSIDLISFGLGKQFSDFSKKCAGLHTGKDGVEKTWSTVDIVVKSSLKGIKL